MRGFIIYFFRIVIVAFLVVESAGLLVLYSFRETLFYKTSHAHVEHGIHYRYIVLGSSRGLTSIDTRKLLNGARGFNYSMDDTHLGSHKLMLQHLIHNSITADTLFLIYENTAGQVGKIASSDYRFLPFISDPHVKRYYEEKKAPLQYQLGNVLPFIPLGYFNVELFFPALYTLADRKFKYKYDDVGDYNYPVGNFKPDGLKDVEYSLNFNNNELTEIRKICAERNIKLILVITPSFRTQYIIPDSEGIEVIDLSQEISGAENFYDRIHLNRIGKDSVTMCLQKYLTKSK